MFLHSPLETPSFRRRKNTKDFLREITSQPLNRCARDTKEHLLLLQKYFRGGRKTGSLYKLNGCHFFYESYHVSNCQFFHTLFLGVVFLVCFYDFVYSPSSKNCLWQGIVGLLKHYRCEIDSTFLVVILWKSFNDSIETLSTSNICPCGPRRIEQV